MDYDPETTIRSVEISCNIIQSINEMGTASVSELADRLAHSKSTIHDHLATLRSNELVVREDKQYRLSLQFVTLSQRVNNQRFDYPIIREAVDELADKTGERARFGSEDYGTLVYIYEVRGDSDIGRHSNASIQESLHCTALGKSILAFEPQRRIDEIVDHRGLEQRTQNTISDYDELIEELGQIRSQKFAVDDEESTRGMRCVAAPVMGDDTAIGAIGVSGPVSRLDDNRISEELAQEVRRVANIIEINSIFSE